MNEWQLSECPLTASQSQIDPYRFPGAWDFDDHPDDLRGRDTDARDTGARAAGEDPGARGSWSSGTAAPDEAGDYLLPAPDPRRRPSAPAAPDRRRLELHAALTAMGIPPLPGDIDAITALCVLDDLTVAAVLRWVRAPLMGRR